MAELDFSEIVTGSVEHGRNAVWAAIHSLNTLKRHIIEDGSGPTESDRQVLIEILVDLQHKLAVCLYGLDLVE